MGGLCGSNASSNNSSSNDNDSSSSPSTSIGAVSNTGQYAGDGFEWKQNDGGYLTRTYTGVNQGATGSYDTQSGFSGSNVQQFAGPSTPAPAVVADEEPDETGSFFTGGGSDGVGQYGAVGDYFGSISDSLGISNYGAGAAQTQSMYQPRTFNEDQLGALTTENSTRENMANFLTPGDGAEYVNGQLIEEATGKSLTGGGTIKNKAGFDDYIYGVSDDFSNNAAPEQGTMSNEDYALELQKFKIRQSQLEQIPPSDAAYFGSFIPGQIVPVIGEYVGSKMLEGGINDRRAMMDEHQAALNAGAKAIMQDGVYMGYETDDGVVKYQEDRPVDPMTDSNIGALNMGNDGNNGTNGISATATGQNSAMAQQVFNRYYKGGSGFAMPFWLRRYASGNVINKDLARVTKDGVDYYQDQTGTLIPTSELAGLKMIAN